MPSFHANVNFFPQSPATFTGVSDGATPPALTAIGDHTLDPLLAGGWGGSPAAWHAPTTTPLWFDLPDLSTPLLRFGDPGTQVSDLTEALLKRAVLNEYVATSSNGVDVATDWIFSQPTRRYLVTVDHDANELRYSSPVGGSGATPADDTENPYWGHTGLAANENGSGPMACVTMNFASNDREEAGTAAGGGYSPAPAPARYCGEVMVATFNGASALGAKLTARSVHAVGDAGWAAITTPAANGLPVTGYAAELFEIGGTKYSLTIPHSWK